MPYIPKIHHLVKILLRRRDERAAEGLWYEGTWLSENGDDKGALMAFSHARLLDRTFGGAYYNYAALTEKLNGNTRATIRAWEEYLAVARNDTRQPRDLVARVSRHIQELKQHGNARIR